jgi:hypothetical protein
MFARLSCLTERDNASRLVACEEKSDIYMAGNCGAATAQLVERHLQLDDCSFEDHR